MNDEPQTLVLKIVDTGDAYFLKDEEGNCHPDDDVGFRYADGARLWAAAMGYKIEE